MDFKPSIPRAYSDSWREAYHEEDGARLSTYQAPNGDPVSFSLDTMRISGGQSLDTAEYPWGFWGSTILNEAVQEISIEGFIIGEKYIAARDKMIEALRVVTDDDNAGYLDLPLWGRFPVIVKSWSVNEAGRENGKTNLSIEFIRAGVSDDERAVNIRKKLARKDVKTLSEELSAVAVESFEKKLEGSIDTDTLQAGFSRITKTLSEIVGRVQGAKRVMNAMASKVNSITNLIAQGVRSPLELAQAVTGAVSSVIAGIIDIKNGITDVENMFSKRNANNALMQFLTADKYEIDTESVTDAQQRTKESMESFYIIIAFSSASYLMTELSGSGATYDRQIGHWKLLERLEGSIDKEDTEIYKAVEKLKVECARELLDAGASRDLVKNIKDAMPILSLSLLLGCDEERLREMNVIEDSFLIKGDVMYV